MKILKYIFPVFLLLIVALFLLNRVPNKAIDFNPDDFILIFTSPTCPHCQAVKEFVSTNSLESKLPIKFLDLTQNQSYSNLLSQKASICQIDQKSIGIPFYFYGGKCLMGDQPIIDVLSQMLQ